MTDMTFAPMVVNAFLIVLIAVDLLSGQWSILTSVELGMLVVWNSLMLWFTYGPQKPPMTQEEFKAEYPELWVKWYFPEAWNGFWGLNEDDDLSGSET